MSDKSREEFEVFAAANASLKQYPFDKYPVDGDEYDAIPLQCAWSAWQASRAALVIELPPEDTNIDYHGYISRQDAVEAIEAAGLKVKP